MTSCVFDGRIEFANIDERKISWMLLSCRFFAFVWPVAFVCPADPSPPGRKKGISRNGESVFEFSVAVPERIKNVSTTKIGTDRHLSRLEHRTSGFKVSWLDASASLYGVWKVLGSLILDFLVCYRDFFGTFELDGLRTVVVA